MASNNLLYDPDNLDNVVEFDPAKWIEADNRRAVANVVNSFETDPKKAAEAGRLADVTGSDPDAILNDYDNFKNQHKTALASELINSNAYLRQFINDYPYSSRVVHRDLGQLDEVTQKLREGGFIPGSQIAAAPSSIINETVLGLLKGWNYDKEGTERPGIGTGALRQPGMMELWNKGGFPQAGLMVANLLGIPFELLDRSFTAVTSAAHGGLKEGYIQFGGSEQGAERFATEMTRMLEMQLMGVGVHAPKAGVEQTADRIQGTKVLKKIAEAQQEPAEPVVGPGITIRDAQGTVYPPPPPTRAELMGSVSPEMLDQGNKLFEFIKAGKEPPIGISPAYDMIKYDQALKEIENFGNLEKAFDATETKELDPDMAAGYVKTHTNAEIRLPAEVVRGLYGDKVPTPDDGLLGWVPGIAERLAQEELTGGHIDIPLGDWLAKTDTELKNQLHDYIVVRRGSVSKKDIEIAKEDADKPTLPQLNSGDGPMDALREQVSTEAMFDRERQRKLSLRRGQPPEEIREVGKFEHYFDLVDSQDKVVGDVNVTVWENGKHLKVEWIGATPRGPGKAGVLGTANVFGPRVVRDLLAQIRREFPEAETLGGYRISGARALSEDVVVNLKNPEPAIMERMAFALNLASSELSLVPVNANFAPGKRIIKAVEWNPIATFKASDALDMIKIDQIARGSIPRALYDFFGKRIRELAGDVDIIVVPDTEFADKKPGAGAFYSALSHAVVMPARAIDGSHGKSWGPEVLMHELAHAATYRAMSVDPAFEAMFEALRVEADHYMRNVLPEQHKHTYYGLTNAAEFVAEGWGNQDFQQILSHVPMSKELAAKIGLTKANTLWDAFRELIAHLLERIVGRRPDPVILDGLLQLSSRFEDYHAMFPEIGEPGIKGVLQGVFAEPTPKPTEAPIKAPPKEGPQVKLPIKTPAAAGLTAQQMRLYERLINRKMMEDYEAGLGKAVKEETKRQSKEWKENYAEMAKEVENDILARPDVAAWQWLKNGTLFGNRVGKITLNSQLLTPEQKAMLPPEFVRRGGKDPDAVAAEFGYESGRSMIERLGMLKQAQDATGRYGRKFIDHLVERETQRRMEDKYGIKDENIMQEAKDRIANQTVLDIIAEDYLRLALEAGIEKLPLDKVDIKNAITDEFNKLAVKHVDSDTFFTEMGKAGNTALTRALQGEYGDSLKSKETQYYAAQRGQLAVEFEKELAKFEKLAKTYSKRGKPGDLVAATDQAYTNMIHSILVRIGREVDRTPEDLATEIKKSGYTDLRDFNNQMFNNRFGMDDMPIPEFLMDGTVLKPVEEMSVAQFREVHDALQMLSKMGKAELKYTTEGETIQRQELVNTLVEKIETFPLKKYAVTAREVNFAKRMLASSTNLETLLNRWDRNDPYGPWNRYIVYPLAGAANYKAKLQRDFAAIYKEIGEFKDQNKKIDSPLIDPLTITKEDPEGKPFSGFTMGNVMVMIHNMGNESNWNVLARGYNMDPAVLRQWVFDNSTKEMWDRAQKMGDMFKKAFEMAQTEYRHIYGVAPEPIQLKPIETPFGTYEGWYHPLLKDPIREVFIDGDGNIIAKQSKDQMGKSPYDNTDNSHIRTANGYTKSRTGAIYPVDLNPDMIPIRLSQILHDIAFRRVIIEAEKIFRDPKLRQTITQRYGAHYAEGLLPYLEGLSGQESMASASLAQGYRISNYLRQNTISTYIGFNVFTALKHGPTAFVMSTVEAGPRYWAKLIDVEAERLVSTIQRLYTKSEDIQRQNIDFVDKWSEEVGRRKRHWQDTIHGEHAYLYGKGTSREKMIQAGSWLVAGSDMFSVRPTWLAVYEKAIENDASHGLAVDIANRAVRRAHGSTAITNQPEIVRGGGPIHSWLTSIYGFFGTVMQRRIELAHVLNDTYKLGREGEIKKAAGKIPDILGRLMAHVVMPIIIEEAVTGLTTDDRRGWGTHLISGLTHGFGASIVYLRDWTHAISTGHDPGVGLISSPLHDASVLFRDLRRGDQMFSPQYAGKTAGDTITVLGHLFGRSPKELGNLTHFGIDLLNEQAHPYTTEDWFMGLTKGTTKKRVEK